MADDYHTNHLTEMEKAQAGEKKWANDPSIKHIHDVCECTSCKYIREERKRD